MTQFLLTYARTVILKRYIEAEGEDEAWGFASDLETNCELGLVHPKVTRTNSKVALRQYQAEPSSWVDAIVDDDTTWNVERA